LALLPQILAGDIQAAMNKLHTEEPKKPEEPKKKAEEPKKEPQVEKPGLLKSLFGKK
jgi:hypothetical protein